MTNRLIPKPSKRSFFSLSKSMRTQIKLEKYQKRFSKKEKHIEMIRKEYEKYNFDAVNLKQKIQNYSQFNDRNIILSNSSQNRTDLLDDIFIGNEDYRQIGVLNSEGNMEINGNLMVDNNENKIDYSISNSVVKNLNDMGINSSDQKSNVSKKSKRYT